MSIAAIPPTMKRPGLAYQYAFDWLAQQLHAADGPTGCILDQPMHESEMLSRIPSLPLLPKEHFSLADPMVVLPAIGWVLPQQSGPDNLNTIQKWVQVGGRLHIIAAGPLAPLLSEQQNNKRPLLSTGRLLRANTLTSWKVTERFGLHGFRGVAWHFIGTAVGALGHANLQDRCHFGMRRSFVEYGMGKSLTALTCMTMERTK